MSTRRGATASAVLVGAIVAVTGCSAAPTTRLEAVTLPASEITLPATGTSPTIATRVPSPSSTFPADELERIDEVSAAGYWDVRDGITWEYRITTSTGFEVDAIRTSRVVDVRDDGVDLSLTHEYTFADDRFDPVTIVSDAQADADGGYREALQLTYNQAWRQAFDPVFDADFTIPGPSQLQAAGAQPQPIAVGPLGTGPFAEFERSTRTIRTAGAGQMTVLGTQREVLCFTEVRSGEVEGPDGSATPFDRRADLCFAQGLGLVSSRTEAGETWEEWTLVASTSARA
ncbi:MAG: hypothetical protein WC580_06275 [Agrococcus sp.]